MMFAAITRNIPIKRRWGPITAARGNHVRKLMSTLDDRSVTIGDITVDDPPRGNSPHLIPRLPSGLKEHSEVEASLPELHLSCLRWMLQKDLILGQDFLLLGAPNLARDRRHIVLLYASLIGREVEWVSITRDTSEADLKQRKEVSNNGTIYVNQAPVRAALNGRLLVLDGLEKAERNVLPTLNNLLENREMPLDDGSMLVSPFREVEMGLSVHPDFRVAALSSLSPGESAALDPPLRSRFQARFAPALDVGDMLVAASARSEGKLSTSTLKDMVQLAGNSSSLESVHDAVAYLERFQHSIAPDAALNAHGINTTGKMISVDDIASTPLSDESGLRKECMPGFVETDTTRGVQDLVKSAFQCNKAVAIVGPKGCYKSAVARNLAHTLGMKCELMSLYPDLTARDLLMTRGTCPETGDTIWRETALTRSARKGTLVVLDGVDKIRSDALSSLALLLEQGMVVLPDGSRFEANEKFRCIALAHPPSEKSWIAPESRGMFVWIEAKPLPRNELQAILARLYPGLKRKVLNTILDLHEELDSITVDSRAEKETLQLSLRKLKHICRRVEQRPSELSSVIRNTLMTSFLPDWERGIVEKCMARCIDVPRERSDERHLHFNQLDDLIDSCRRSASDPLLVPNPRFEMNPGQAKVMLGILEAHAVGERALLISGYQGVGKNKVADYILQKLNCEREYLQLHRDTTVQSLLVSPAVEHGRIVWNDSPLVRAAKHGRILLLDEADKAPTEVVSLLKGLIEDGQLSLPDGRMLCYDNDNSDPDIISIHDGFRIWSLTNPAGWPFHGNDLSREMSDVFSCHILSPLDSESHKRILESYGDSVRPQVIDKIVDIWEELRLAHQEGQIAYPFSVRESVNVVKHLNSFPMDGIEQALDNVIAFDRLDESLSKHLNGIFGEHGIDIFSKEVVEQRHRRAQGGFSTPKTRASHPKHGKETDKPHVGGNTWAGGTGGSDTAGLGGRGGPYRLDLGHPVHQISDEMKAEVSEDSKTKAREMASSELEKKLKELDIGKLDWKRYSNLRGQVEEQIAQLKGLLKDIKKRSEERVWLKNQTTGELDDNRIVDALAGERNVFQRRGSPDDASNDNPLHSDPMTIRLIVDISASMYRFNSYDHRLERLLEATLMLMESLKNDKRFQLYIIGHNGSSAKIPLVNPTTELDEATQLRVLECMVANTQYTYAGDNTVEAISLAVEEAEKGDLIVIISDANLSRYDISIADLSPLQARDVHAHLILIGSLGDEAEKLASCIPNERAQVCKSSGQLPLMLKKIVTSALSGTNNI